jgi:TolB-like protein/Tfp pilus assembly protein PilF
VKILDFGLAKLAGQTKVTKTGMTVGTVAYMSPEQARGDETDSRSDIWSLGVMLYETLAGRLPFRGEADAAMVYSILNEDPVPVTTTRREVPIGVEDIIEKALSKDPEKRYGTMEDLLSDLETQRDQLTLGIKERRFRALRKFKRRKRLVTGTMAVVILAAAVVAVQMSRDPEIAIDSIAVLPLENLTGDSEQEYFVDGMTDALISELSKIGALRVISKTSVMRYRGTDKPLPEIARELDVGAVVEGSVLRAGDRIRITAQLIGAEPERHLWAENYDQALGDILVLHSEVSRAIAHEIQVTLTPHEQAQLVSVRPVNPEAYELYLRGRYQIDEWEPKAWERAAEYFEKATDIDTNYAEAYAMLATCYVHLAWGGHLPFGEAFSQATALTKKALDIDDTISEAYFALGYKRFYLDWDWLGGRKELNRAIELDPNNAEAHAGYAWMLMTTGRSEEAFAEAKISLRIDPVAYTINMTMAWMYYLAGQCDEAIAHYEQIVELHPNRPEIYNDLAYICGNMGRYEDAVRAYQKTLTLRGDAPEKIAAVDSAYGESGPEGYWRWHLERVKGWSERYPAFTAICYAQLGEIDQAFTWLEKAFEKRDSWMFRLKVEPCWDPLRDDPRFQDLLRRMKFPENQTTL